MSQRFDDSFTWLAVSLISVGLLAGCADAMDGADSSLKNESFLAASSGKADAIFNVQPGSEEAEGILELANTADIVTLDKTDEVGLDIRAAENIIEARSESKIETLKELDAISWVSRRAFRKLYDYAESNGYFEGNTNEDSTSDDPIHGIEPGSELAKGVLEVVNTLDEWKLDDNVGLDSRAAEHIVETRQNSDIETLEELDAISWVSRRAFDKLSSYADLHDYPKTDSTDDNEKDSSDDWSRDNDGYDGDKRESCYAGHWSASVLCP